MLTIKFDEKFVFTYFDGEPWVGIHQHRDGKYTGPVESVGRIEFDSFDQMLSFYEMIELNLDNEKKKNKV